jgi:hypothetical protein
LYEEKGTRDACHMADRGMPVVKNQRIDECPLSKIAVRGKILQIGRLRIE